MRSAYSDAAIVASYSAFCCSTVVRRSAIVLLYCSTCATSVASCFDSFAARARSVAMRASLESSRATSALMRVRLRRAAP